jgi:hypothetical protein
MPSAPPPDDRGALGVGRPRLHAVIAGWPGHVLQAGIVITTVVCLLIPTHPAGSVTSGQAVRGMALAVLGYVLFLGFVALARLSLGSDDHETRPRAVLLWSTWLMPAAITIGLVAQVWVERLAFAEMSGTESGPLPIGALLVASGILPPLVALFLVRAVVGRLQVGRIHPPGPFVVIQPSPSAVGVIRRIAGVDVRALSYVVVVDDDGLTFLTGIGASPVVRVPWNLVTGVWTRRELRTGLLVRYERVPFVGVRFDDGVRGMSLIPRGSRPAADLTRELVDAVAVHSSRVELPA